MINDTDGNWYPVNSEDKIRLAEIAERLKALGLLKRYPEEIKTRQKLVVKKSSPPPPPLHSNGRFSGGVIFIPPLKIY